MNNYIVKKLEDVNSQDRLCGELWPLSSSEDFEEANMSYFKASKPAKPHYHKEITEMYFIISGEGKIILDENEEKLNEGTFILIEPPTIHQVIPGKHSELEIVVCSIPAWREEDEFEINEEEFKGV